MTYEGKLDNEIITWISQDVEVKQLLVLSTLRHKKRPRTLKCFVTQRAHSIYWPMAICIDSPHIIR